MQYLKFLFTACVIVGLSACGGSAQPAPKVLIIQAMQPVAGIELGLSSRNTQGFSLDAMGFDKSTLGLGADVVVMTRPDANGDVSLVAFSQGAFEVAYIRLFTVTGGASLPMITRLRCADKVGNPVDCQVHWE